ncbi:MAG: hypothetical protein ACRC33_21805 [Gemmataceae bacterium]
MAVNTPPASDPDEVEHKRKLTFARGKYFLWVALTAAVLVALCLPLTAEAIRGLLPSLGTKLSKTAIIGGMFSGRSMAKLDAAYVAAGAVYAVVLFFWRELLALWLDPDADTDFNEGPYKTLVTLCGLLVLGIDGVLMYIAVASLNWGEVTFSLVALLFTLTYVVGLVFASLMSMRLKKDIKKLEDNL